MRIQLKNGTPYRDDDLRAIVREACKAAGVSCKKLRFVVKLRRSGRLANFHGGRASCRPGRRARWISAYLELILPRPEFVSLKETALVALHEAMHLAGATHSSMTEEQLHCTGPLPAWAASLELRVQDQSPPKGERLAAARADRLAHAEAMLARAVTRAKRAETIRKKWARRVTAMRGSRQ